MENLIENLPPHLRQYVCYQNYDRYTAVNQAVWRYVMRQNLAFLPGVAHESYVEGLRKTGISPDHIPTMHGMNRILKEIGWAALAVDGFIPPNAFMEFQAYQILVIAQDIRKVEHIDYTPAPDIIHEAAGHAPIIANPAYSEYLRRFGAIGSKAIGSKIDWEIYNAVRHLSIIKEYQHAKPSDILDAEENLNQVLNQQNELSELAMIRNLHWWTVEYGLIGSLDKPKIYGAGLLSSIGESQNCLSSKIQKLPYDISAAYKSFDITQAQPQLFVTPNFPHLSFVLEQFANSMSLRKGGRNGLAKLIDSGQLGTIELNTGVQISGVFSEMICDAEDQAIYFQTTGPTALAYRDKELVGHSTKVHAHGFGSPIGKLLNINIPIEEMSPYDLEAYKIKEECEVKLEFEGGVTVEGKVLTGIRNLHGKIILISFSNCTVRYGDRILFDSNWGQYDMIIGSKIISASAGAADPYQFPVLDVHNIEKSPQQAENKTLIDEYFEAIQDYIDKKSNNKALLIDILEKTKDKEFSEKKLLLSELKNLDVF